MHDTLCTHYDNINLVQVIPTLRALNSASHSRYDYATTLLALEHGEFHGAIGSGTPVLSIPSQPKGNSVAHTGVVGNQAVWWIVIIGSHKKKVDLCMGTAL